MKPSVVIICGGGPAPGINTVIATVAKSFIADGFRVLGVHHGYQGLFSENPEIKEFDFEHADRIFSRGGSTLIMSRFKPKDTDFNTRLFEKENVKLLVTIGGDDTASTANRIAKFLKSKNIDISNIHVPKTIDNDLPLPDRNPTFGFHSAKDEGVRIGHTVYEDARTSRQWFVMSAMGRSAGHLAFGIATGCHFPMLVIPEMFNKTEVTLDKIINLIISSIVKRKILGIEYGVAMVSEGVFHILDIEEVEKSGITFTYDAHGHPELGNVSKAHIFNILLQKRLHELDIHIKSRPTELGYELRCARPIGFDLTLCSLLGLGVKKLFIEGVTGCIVSANSTGDISPIYLEDFQKDGKVAPRLLDIDAQISKLFMEELHYLTAEDREVAKTYLPDPENYEFDQVLNWA